MLIRRVIVYSSPRDYDLVSIMSKAYWQLRLRWGTLCYKFYLF